MRRLGILLLILAIAATLGWAVVSDRKPSDEFAADRDAAPGGALPFDAARAMGYLKQLCDLGPRISGSEGMRKQRELVKKHFESCGATVRLQEFTARQYSQRTPTPMANVIASWWPDRKQRVLLCSHYDTRPHADNETDPRRRREPFISANDGTSGVALLMELANHMKDLKCAVGVDLVLFDGEEFIFDNRPSGDKYFFGSEHFAAEYRRGHPKYTYTAAILLDMIGGQEIHFPIEMNSWWNAAELVKAVWKVAHDQGCSAFEDARGPEVLDDHLALNKAGIPAIDIIDFNYPHWHKLSDLPENCSGASLAQVARVLTVWLQHVQ
jgi:hypothetical protein